ncbi:MAG: sugar phosphate isomerase/epimerase [Kiritimatiellae bacterium]|nr:sugar phosphate isomerase/epimerase [Kiritimatiellia bacterium]MDD5523094.1 sugar phosphate isomerase/epimerase [Kiritimatiellia bacterium]
MKAGKAGMTRREVLGSLGLMALAGRVGFSPYAAQAEDVKQKAGIAMQLYTMRDPAKKDLADTLKKVADMGWKYVQWSGMPNQSADQIRAALDKAGLKCIACHCSMEPFEKNFDEQVAFWKTVGNKDVAPGGMMKDCTTNLEAWRKGAQRLDAIGAKLHAVGMRLSYHNHAWEFEKFPGDDRTKEDILMESTKPENLCAEIDIAWALAGGVDPAAYIRKMKNRCPVVHAKDVTIDGKKRTLKALGQGSVKWDEVFAAGKEAGIQWYVYEQDSGEGSPFDYAKASYDFLAKQSL